MIQVFKDTCKFWKVNKLRTTAYHPQTNGGLEQSHAVLKDYLRTFVNSDKSHWGEWVKAAVFMYNTSENTSTKYTPFKLRFSWNPMLPKGAHRAPEIVYNYSNYVIDLKNKLQNCHAVAKENILKAKGDSKKRYDRKSSSRKFAVGDKLLLSSKEFKTGLDPRWLGPYEIVHTPTEENSVLQMGRRMTRVNNNRLKIFSAEDSGDEGTILKVSVWTESYYLKFVYGLNYTT